MKYLITLIIFLAFATSLYAQIDYSKIKRKKLSPTQIDTLAEPILILNRKHAILYFRQSDIKERIGGYNVIGVRLDKRQINLEEILSRNIKRIELDDIWSGYTDEERKIQFSITDSWNDQKKYILELYYIGADLIHDGKFMIKEKITNQFTLKGLRIKRIKGLYGTRYVDFQLPNRDVFWSILTVMGE